MKNKRTVLTLYTLFIISLILSFIPLWSVSLVAFLLFMGVWIAAYIVRDQHRDDPYAHSHMSAIIRTIWVGSLVVTIAMGAGIAYMLSFIDQAPIMPCMSGLQTVMQSGTAPDLHILKSVFDGCWDNYWAVNGRVFITSMIIIVAPIVIYFAWRVIRGLRMAIAGQPVANPKAWF